MAINAFLFPHRITIVRPGAPLDSMVGKQPYQGVRRDVEEPVLVNVPASIQYSATGRSKGADVPSDTSSLTVWRVITPRGVVGPGVVIERDVVVDETGRRFQIIAAYWTSMGLSMRATLLQA